MGGYRFELEKGSRIRYECPSCGQKEFTRYIDSETNLHLAYNVGKCSRIVKCKYHYSPRQYFEDNKGSMQATQRNYAPKKPLKINAAVIQKRKTISNIDIGTFKKSFQVEDYEENKFIKYLLKVFGSEITNQIIEKYYIGNSNHRKGSTVFWQVDIHKGIRSGKVMLYNPDTGKRIRDKNPTWIHTVEKLQNFEFKQCLFGEYLLKDKNDPVALVESEKTAIIASLYLPQFIWLACGGLTNLPADKYKVLQGRKVILFPDLNGYEQWTLKANEMSLLLIPRVTVSQYLLRIATEEQKQQGLDIADFLLQIPCPTIPLRDQFRYEFLKEGGVSLENQLSVWLSYYDRGLSPVEAKAVCIELKDKYGFEYET